MAKREQYKRGDDGDVSEDSITLKKRSPLPDADSERGIYERLCRGEKFPVSHDAQCKPSKYSFNGSPRITSGCEVCVQYICLFNMHLADKIFGLRYSYTAADRDLFHCVVPLC